MLIGNIIVVQFVFHLNVGIMAWVFTVMLIFFFFQTPLFSQSNTLVLNAIEGTNYKFGSIRYFGSLGYALMAMIAGPIISMIGINYLWIIYSIFILLTIALCLQLPNGNLVPAKKMDPGEYRKILFESKFFLLFITIGILISVPNSINGMFVSLYIHHLGGDFSMIGMAAFSSAFLEIPVFILLDRYLTRNIKTMFSMLIIVSALYSLRWFLMALATKPIHIIFVQALHSISFGGYFYIGTILTAQLIPANMRASGQALYALSWSGISGVIAGLFGGFLYERLGPQMMYGTTTIISLIGVLGMVILWLRIRQSESLIYEKSNSF